MLKAIRDSALLMAFIAAVLATAGCADTTPPPRPVDRVDVKAGPVDVQVDKNGPAKKVDVKTGGGRVDVDVKP